jgi:hypothetical protein
MHDENASAAAMWLPREAHPDIERNTKFLCVNVRSIANTENFFPEVKTLNQVKPSLFVQNWVEHRFKPLVDRTIRERRSEERRLAERRTRKHHLLQARKSCIPDARSYRVARPLFLLARAQF